MRPRKVGLLIVAGVAALAGCQPTVHTDLTFQRGVQLLAAGSPKSAIPFLTQVIASAPDGPEPHAMLSLAYALDLQSDRAILQAGRVHRAKGEAPGWELVAVGIAETLKGQQPQATQHLQQAVGAVPPGSPMALAARQWLTLSLLAGGNQAEALESIEELGRSGPARTTALLWAVLVHSRQGHFAPAAQALAKAAQDIGVFEPSLPDGGQEADDQSVYDTGVLALAKGQLTEAGGLFDSVQRRNPDASDAPVWLSLIAAASGDWPLGRARLAEACRSGSLRSRGLANQVLSVVCAIERRPDAMIRSMMVGQRLLGRSNLPAHVVAQPDPDAVWLSDKID